MQQDLVNVLVIGGIYMLFALGLTLSWGVLNILNLAHGAIFMSGGLAAYLITRELSLPIWVVLPFVMVTCGLLATVLESVAFRPIRRRATDFHAAELATLVGSIAASAMLISVAENVTGGELVAINRETFTVVSHVIWGVRITNLEIIIIVVALVLSTALALFVKRSRYGRALRALSKDPYMCGLLGISPDRMAAATMFVSGAMAGTAGLLLALQQNSVDAYSGEPLMLKAFAVIILGGVGSIGGAIVAAFLLAAAEIATDVYIGTDYTATIAFALILTLLLLRPEGLLSQSTGKRS